MAKGAEERNQLKRVLEVRPGLSPWNRYPKATHYGEQKKQTSLFAKNKNLHVKLFQKSTAAKLFVALVWWQQLSSSHAFLITSKVTTITL